MERGREELIKYYLEPERLLIRVSPLVATTRLTRREYIRELSTRYVRLAVEKRQIITWADTTGDLRQYTFEIYATYIYITRENNFIYICNSSRY